jgi:hypothetical protein
MNKSTASLFLSSPVTALREEAEATMADRDEREIERLCADITPEQAAEYRRQAATRRQAAR